MKRRTLLGGLGVAIAGGGAWAIGTDVEDLKDLVGKDDTPYKESFGPFSPGFNRVTWINLDVLRIYFEENHNMDGFGVMHEYDNYEDALVLTDAPQYSGPVDVPLIRMIRNSGRNYPNRWFKLVAYKGEFGHMDFIQENLGSVKFQVPANIWPQ